MPESINNVAHYKGTAVMEFIELFELDFKIGNAVKYLSRAGRKHTGDAGILEDLKKAQWYLNRSIALREAAIAGGNAVDQNTHSTGDGKGTSKRAKVRRHVRVRTRNSGVRG